jgi:hypothetical protein
MPEEKAIDAELVDEKIVPYTVNRLGAFKPAMVINEAIEIANALKDVIKTQELFTIIGRGDRAKAYVHLEGWSIVGGMMGVFPLEVSVVAIDGGYEATIDLMRARDDKRVGRASSICTRSESLWADRDEYAIRSMAITRATSKAYRLSYGWLIKLAGFDPLPVEEAGQLAAVEALAAYQQRESEQLPNAKEQAQELGKAKAQAMEAHKTDPNAFETPIEAVTGILRANIPPMGEVEDAILEEVRLPEGKRKFAVVKWKGNEHSVWDVKLFSGLVELKGKRVILYTAASSDGKHSNVLSFELPALQQGER